MKTKNSKETISVKVFTGEQLLNDDSIMSDRMIEYDDSTKSEIEEVLTAEQMLEIEPSLFAVENYVKRNNEEAEYRTVYWHKVWKQCKKMQDILVGWYARNNRLRSSKCWDIWHAHLKSLATSCE